MAISEAAWSASWPCGVRVTAFARASRACCPRVTSPDCSIRRTSEAMVFGSLAMAAVISVCVRMPSGDSEIQRRTENWSGVSPIGLIRWRNAWFRPNQAFRRRGGRRRSRRGGESLERSESIGERLVLLLKGGLVTRYE